MTAGLRVSFPPGSRLGRAVALSLGIGIVALLASPLAFYAFFTGFQEYDDEGYLLISLREYARGGVLYDEVYSQYGPAYFQLLTALFRVAGLTFVHTHGRILALALLAATAIVCAVVTWRLSRSLLIALAVELLVVQALLPSRAEPLHPGALLALLLGGLVLVGTCLDGPRWRVAAGFGGVLLATMLLVKVNVGLFAAVGIAGALAAAGPPGRPRGAVVAGIAALADSPPDATRGRADGSRVPRRRPRVRPRRGAGRPCLASRAGAGPRAHAGLHRLRRDHPRGVLGLGARARHAAVEPSGGDRPRPSAPSGRVLPRAGPRVGRVRDRRDGPRGGTRLRVGAPPRADRATIGIRRGGDGGAGRRSRALARGHPRVRRIRWQVLDGAAWPGLAARRSAPARAVHLARAP